MGVSGAVQGTATPPPMLLLDEAGARGGALLHRLRVRLTAGAPWVGLETDGTRLARDHAFALAIGHLGARVHLRVAGCSERAHLAIHGRDLRRTQRRALDACADAGVAVTFLTGVQPGLNDTELGDVALFGLEHPAVRGAAFHPCLNPMYPPLSAEDLVSRLTTQLPGMLRPGHFTRVSGGSIACLIPDGEEILPISLPTGAPADLLESLVEPPVAAWRQRETAAGRPARSAPDWSTAGAFTLAAMDRAR
jgi:hypothetical protein